MIKCLILESKCEENGFSKCVKLTPPRKYKWAEANQNAGKGTKKWRKKNELKRNLEEKTGWNENEKKQGRKTKVEWVLHAMKNDPQSNYPETQLGLLILSFGIPNPGLHYVPKKSVLIKYGYSNWRGFSLSDFFCNQQSCCLFSSAKFLINHSPVRDEFLNFRVHNRTMKKMKKKKHDSRLKTRKGGLE